LTALSRAAQGSISTILFTDVVDSTVLLQRLGDERAQRVFEHHHRMLADTLAASGGEELQWLGDGQMAAFASPADAVRCAVAMQQGAGRSIDGERLRIRVGLNVGEIMRGAGGGYFGTPVVTVRRRRTRANRSPAVASTVRATRCPAEPTSLQFAMNMSRFARQRPHAGKGVDLRHRLVIAHAHDAREAEGVSRRVAARRWGRADVASSTRRARVI
jgi:class 3 adenylate cyclase